MKKLFVVLIILNFSISCNRKPANTDNKLNVTVKEVTNKVYFKWPKDKSTVSSPVFVDMGLEGMKIEPAGKVNLGFGHHHILINQKYWPKGSVIPMSDSTLHYGQGQTDASLDLPPGEYILSLQFADGVHASYGKEMSSSIKIKVE